MSLIAPFRAILPTPRHARAVAAPPYDVLSTAEARARAAGNPLSFLHVSRPEIDLPEGVAGDDPAVYAKAAETMARLLADGTLGRAERAGLYVYRAEIDGHRQTGIAGAAPVAALGDGRIRRHELTRPAKVADRARQIEAVGAHTGPVMLSWRDDPKLADAVAAVAAGPPALEAGIDGVAHSVWAAGGAAGAALRDAAGRLETLYIADGHHRSEAASRVGASFLAIGFPASEMRILDYNRAVRDLAGRSPEEFLAALREVFAVAPSDRPARPEGPRRFGLYLAGRWYSLALQAAPAADGDPAAALDAEILTRTVLAPLLGIADLRSDPRIDFVGGGRGLDGLAARVDSGEMAAAFALHPVTLEALFAVADAGRAMPPKSTWFEPKLADGLLSLPLEG
ncbi:MAG: DUF1015 family protein [Defluviicoccus sp.]|nr:DUF1015 family protein [Defluviicoccus sp.]